MKKAINILAIIFLIWHLLIFANAQCYVEERKIQDNFENKSFCEKNNYSVSFEKRFIDKIMIGGVECGNIPTDGCTITKNTTFNRGSYFLPNGFDIVQRNGITLDCNNSIIYGLGQSEDIPSYGLYLYGANNITIKNCIFRDEDTALSVYYVNYYSSQIEIYNNTFENFNNYGIFVNKANLWNIHDNTIVSNRTNSIGIYSLDNATSIKISNNTFSGASTYGVYAKNSANFSIKKNRFYYKTVYFQNSENVSILDNYIERGLGIISESSKNSFIENNYIFGTTKGVYVSGFSNNTKISGNQIYNTSYGVDFERDTSYNYLENNKICYSSNSDILRRLFNKNSAFGTDNTCSKPDSNIWTWEESNLRGCSYSCVKEKCGRFYLAKDLGFRLLNYSNINNPLDFLGWINGTYTGLCNGCKNNVSFFSSVEFEIDVPENSNKMGISYSYFIDKTSLTSSAFNNLLYIYDFSQNRWNLVVNNTEARDFMLEQKEGEYLIDISNLVYNNKIRIKFSQRNKDGNELSSGFYCLYRDRITYPNGTTTPYEEFCATQSYDRFAFHFCDNIFSCYDRFENGNESDVDCGGTCRKCEDGKKCKTNNDCLNNYCDASFKCGKTSCWDNIKNGGEEGVDCGIVCNKECNSTCRAFINNGNSDEKIDVVFLSSGFPDITSFISAINNSVDYYGKGYGLMSVVPFNFSKQNFNFWYVNKLENFSDEKSMEKNSIKIAKKSCPQTDQLIVLSVSPRFRSFSPGRNVFYGMGSSEAYVCFGCEYLGTCNFPLEIVDVNYGNINCTDFCGDNCGKEKCVSMAYVKEQIIRTVIHEFGHSFGGLIDEYLAGERNYNREIINCDNSSSCTKFSGNNRGCYKECYSSLWYRGFENTIMRNQHTLVSLFEKINENALLDKINTQIQATVSSEGFSNKSYFLGLSYNSGKIEIQNFSVVFGESSISSYGEYFAKIISFKNETLLVYNFTFNLYKKYSPPVSWFNNSEQVYYPNETLALLNYSETAVTLPYYENATIIEISNLTGKITSYDISNYSDIDNDGIIKIVDNCPVKYNPYQNDSDKDSIGDLCDLNERCNDRIDNDNNGLIDYPAELNCKNFTDNSELFADLDNNCLIDIFDFAYLGLCYGKTGLNEQDSCADADLDHDSKISIIDLAKLGKSFGKKC